MSSKEDQRSPNRLISEKSPYLLQHAYNPVNWYPWTREAFAKAKEEDKPVLLSIGYSTCHWCHVMERESFEDPDVARLLNDAFVCVKVDREERPDLDAAYMKVCHTLTGSGGWPLHIIMTPDRQPFFAATYIPKESRFGRVGIKELTVQIKSVWTKRRNELVESGQRIVDLFKQTEKKRDRIEHLETLGESTLDEAYIQLSESFDEHNGGFGTAPKFPSPHLLLFLLRYWKRTQDDRALQMTEKTLKSMRAGGIYDHLGFGFHRYSTDSRWLIPHFEKMLYDQAMLTMTYTEAYLATANNMYAQTAREVISYTLREMTDAKGAFYSAEDADIEGEEGEFYLWTEKEIRQELSRYKAELALKVFNIEEKGNFSDPLTGNTIGKNILHTEKSLDDLASGLHVSLAQLQESFEEIRQELFSIREKRIRPDKDDKILTDWNGLMIAALSKAAQAFDEEEYARAACKATDFLLMNMRTSEGRLYHRYRCGEAEIDGFLDDYAFLIWGLIELYETVFDGRYLQTAIELAEKMIMHFWDKSNGGFYLTSDDAEVALVRTKEPYDGAYPSGNSIAALDLIRLSLMTGQPHFEEKAEQLMNSFSNDVSMAPSSYAQLMIALDLAVGPSKEIVIVGDPEDSDTNDMLRAIRSRFMPRKTLLLLPRKEERSEITRLAEFTKEFTDIQGKATAYICTDHVCALPTTDIERMIMLIKDYTLPCDRIN